jgi:ribosomal protein L22
MESHSETMIRDGENTFKKAKEHEDKHDFENALFYYKKAAEKFINVLKFETNETRKGVIKEMGRVALDRAQMIKI